MTSAARSAVGMDAGTLLEAIGEVARVAGSRAMQHFRRTVAVEMKADGSPVTVADREAEMAARDWIRARFPDDGILGEELGVERADAPCRWLLDPIDGTRSFVQGVPLWGTLVAVAVGERVLAGAAYFAPVDEMLVAAPGQGCWWNGARAKVSTIARLRDATVLTTDERFPDRRDRLDRWRGVADAARLARSWGDCFGYLLVATGRAEVMVDPVLSPWDSAALQPLIAEAGGVFTDWGGREWGFGGSAIATNAVLAHDVREMLGCSTSTD